MNENVKRNIEQKPEQSEEITFQHSSKYGELESNASDDTQILTIVYGSHLITHS